jgi:protoporphyrin/coproporphyrin ferrochelatase
LCAGRDPDSAMNAYLPEPPFEPDRSSKVGVLLVNLGTPDEPAAPAVRRYLAEFLSDPRVVEIPRVVWLPLLHGVILRVRPARSARKYAQIWGSDGSPLLAHSVKQRTLLAGHLGQRLKDAGLAADRVTVELAMRYGNPGLPEVLDRLRAAGCDRILVVPLFPQYSASATAAVFDAVFARAQQMRRVPGLRTIESFHDDPGYIRALARGVNEYWMRHGRPDVLLLSFHGLPRRSVELGDPYQDHCRHTARLLATELGLEPKQFTVTFQSRFGPAKWLEPYTGETLLALAKDGVRRVDVACPGFVADCLETLEEIGIEGKEAFLGAGGKEFHVLPCLNEHPAWIAALTDLVFRHLQGWVG